MLSMNTAVGASLVGIWSDDDGLGYVSSRWELLIFYSDGTGRVESYNMLPCWYESFQWKLNSNGTIAVLGEHYVEWKDEFPGFSINKGEINHAHLQFSIQHEEISDGSRNEVLTLAQAIGFSKRYGRSKFWCLEEYPLPRTLNAHA